MGNLLAGQPVTVRFKSDGIPERDKLMLPPKGVLYWKSMARSLELKTGKPQDPEKLRMEHIAAEIAELHRLAKLYPAESAKISLAKNSPLG